MALAAADFSRIPDAPTHVTSAKLVAAAGDKPAYREVEGFVAPQVGILAWLPVSGWNGRFLETGCGGYCGMFKFISLCEGPLRRGYACITTDMGHRGNEAEGVEWAYNNPQAVTDFAFRATHVTALAGKAIVQRFYGRKPDKSYLHGCSCGGRQALVEAQRFPDDFDGIVVGAPALSYVDVTLEYALRARDLCGRQALVRSEVDRIAWHRGGRAMRPQRRCQGRADRRAAQMPLRSAKHCLRSGRHRRLPFRGAGTRGPGVLRRAEIGVGRHAGTNGDAAGHVRSTPRCSRCRRRRRRRFRPSFRCRSRYRRRRCAWPN